MVVFVRSVQLVNDAFGMLPVSQLRGLQTATVVTTPATHLGCSPLSVNPASHSSVQLWLCGSDPFVQQVPKLPLAGADTLSQSWGSQATPCDKLPASHAG